MPIYEYQCSKCGYVFEKRQKSIDATVAACPKCDSESKRLISNTSFVLKGSGWYKTDYSGTGSTAKTESTEKNSTPTTESKSSETTAKPETTTAS